MALFGHFVPNIKTSKEVLVKDEVDALKHSRAVEREGELPRVQQEPGDAWADGLRDLIGYSIQAGGQPAPFISHHANHERLARAG